MDQVSQKKEQQALTYSDFEHLASALGTAISGQLMSLEEARAIWKRHLVLVGWKKTNPKEAPTDSVVEVTRKSVKVATTTTA